MFNWMEYIALCQKYIRFRFCQLQHAAEPRCIVVMDGFGADVRRAICSREDESSWKECVIALGSKDDCVHESNYMRLFIFEPDRAFQMTHLIIFFDNEFFV